MNIANTQTSSPPPSQPVCPPVTPPSKAHLLRLPVEIRLRIISHALLPPPPRNDPSLDLTLVLVDISATHKKDVKERPDEYYWGTSRMTPLLLVNRQIHVEAEDVLYSDFRFGFPHYLDAALVRGFLGSLSPRAVRLIRNVTVHVVLRMDGKGGRAEKLWGKAFDALVREVPRLRSVNFVVDFVGMPVEKEGRRKGLVDAVMGLAGVFKGVEILEVARRDRGPRFMLWKDIMRECIERIRAGVW